MLQGTSPASGARINVHVAAITRNRLKPSREAANECALVIVRNRFRSALKELSDYCWRAALLPRCVKRDVDEDMAYWLHGCEAHQLCMESCCSVQPCIVVTDRSDHSRIEGTLRWSSEGWRLIVESANLLHLQMAMMRAVAPAAGWKIRIRIRRECEQRRDQRQAKEQQQRDGQKASHTAIVADGEMQGY